jgi:GH24 family phage-related lysozyme (muramidase)
MTNLSTKGIQAIINWETSGEEYYKKNPIWPGGESGVTIGVGWDLGQTPATETSRAWAPHLDAATLALLVSVSGRKGEAAKEVLKHVRHLIISWTSALSVFENVTLPTWYMRTLRIYPQVVDLPGDCAAALVSLCFNRGTSLSGERRREMSNIQALLRTGNLKEIPKQLREMKRLWPTVEGLRNRRMQEADLFEGGLIPAGE